MKSKPSVFSLVLLLAAITATASPAAHAVTAAAKPEHISATESSCPAAGPERPTRDTRRDESYVGWRRLIPTRLTVQFAGGEKNIWTDYRKDVEEIYHIIEAKLTEEEDG